MLKSKFNQIIIMFLVVYAILMYKLYGDYQSLTSQGISTNDFMKFAEREYVEGAMRQATFAFGFMIIGAFALRSFKRKSTLKKVRQKSIELAQTGRYASSSDIVLAMKPEFDDLEKQINEQLLGELDSICKVSHKS